MSKGERQLLFVSHSKRGLGKAQSSMAINAPSPVEGEVRRTSLPDTFDGIRFEIGRMVRYVQDARKDAMLIDAARTICSRFGRFVEEMSARDGNPISAHNNKTIQLEAIDIWCRQNFFYVNDPPNIEVIQTPRRMYKQTKVAREVIDHQMQPFYEAMEEKDPEFYRGSYEPPPIFTGDCDEAATMICALAACMDISPLKFRFGGNGGTLHHVWAQAYAGGEWYDCDITEPSFKLGDVSDFEAYEDVEIPL